MITTTRSTLAIAVFVIALAGFSGEFSRHLRISGDEAYLQYLALRVSTTAADTHYMTTRNRLERRGPTPGSPGDENYKFARLVFGIQEQTRHEYIGPAYVWSLAVAHLLRRRYAEGLTSEDYPVFFADSVLLMFAASAVVGTVILIVVVSLQRDLAAMVSLWLFVAGMSLLDGIPWAFAGNGGGPTAPVLWRFARAFIAPGDSFHVFGPSGRSSFLLLLPVVLILRWTGHVASSYLALAALSAVHVSQAGLVALWFCGLDAVIRPDVFRRWRISAAAALALILWSARSAASLAPVMGAIPTSMAMVPLVVVAIAIRVMLRSPERSGTHPATPDGSVKPSRWLRPAEADLLWLTLSLFAAAIALGVLARLWTPLTTFPHAAIFVRLGVVGRVVVIFGVCWMVATRVLGVGREFRPLRHHSAAALFALISLAIAGAGAAQSHTRAAVLTRRLREAAQGIHAARGAPLDFTRNNQLHRIWYAVTYGTVTGRDASVPLFKE